jgi:hypothetical protein
MSFGFQRSLPFFILACAAIPVVFPGPASASEVAFDHLVHIFDGTAKQPLVSTEPPVEEVSLAFRPVDFPVQESVSQRVFNCRPEQLAASYSSLAFHSNSLSGLGRLVRFGQQGRRLESAQIVLVNWSKAHDYPALAALNPAGYTHPITLTLYRVLAGNQLGFIATSTTQALVPWRPLTKPDGSPYLFNGIAFPVDFTFPSGIDVPDEVVVMVSYNTQFHGFAPTGIPGPYNSLNVALVTGAPTIGTYPKPNEVLLVKNEQWFYPNTGMQGQYLMLRITARTEADDGFRADSPVDAGSYEVRARTAAGTEALAVMEILPASATLIFGNLAQTRDGTPRVPGVSSDPPGVAVTIRYDDSEVPPTEPGFYTVTATSANPNYAATASATLRVGDRFSAWRDFHLAAGLIPPGLSGPLDRPDADGVTNLEKYVFGFVPGTGAARPGLAISVARQAVDLSFPRYRFADDWECVVESADTPAAAADWQPLGPPVADPAGPQDRVLVERTRVPVAVPGPYNGFFRLRLSPVVPGRG